MSRSPRFRNIDPNMLYSRDSDKVSIAHFEPPKPATILCQQCLNYVTPAQAEACRAPFCKGMA